MQNIKNYSFCLFLMSSILLISHNYVKAGGTGSGVATKATDKIIDACPTAATVNQVAGNVGLNSANVLAGSLPNVGLNAGKEINGGATVLAGAINHATNGLIGGAIGVAAYFVYTETKAAYNWCHPNKKEQLREQEAAKLMEIDRSERAFSSSLAKHLFEKKNSAGIPNACEETAREYAAVAGFDSFTKIKKEFDDACKELDPEHWNS